MNDAVFRFMKYIFATFI